MPQLSWVKIEFFFLLCHNKEEEALCLCMKTSVWQKKETRMMIVSATEIKIQSISNILLSHWERISICLSFAKLQTAAKAKKKKVVRVVKLHSLGNSSNSIRIYLIINSGLRKQISWHFLGFTSLAKNCFVYDFTIHKTVFLVLLWVHPIFLPPFTHFLCASMFILKNNVFCCFSRVK